MTDQEKRAAIRLYRAFCESTYASGFMAPNPELLEEFVEWLKGQPDSGAPLTDYETHAAPALLKAVRLARGDGA